MRIWLKIMGVVCLLTAALPVGVGLLLLATVSSSHLSEDVWRWLHDALAGEIEPVQLVVVSFAAFFVILSCVAFGLATKLCGLESLPGQLSRLRARSHAGDGSDTAPGREQRETIPDWLRAMGWLCLVPALLLARYALIEMSAPWTYLHYALGALAVALVTLSCLCFAVARSVNLEHKIASELGRLGAPSLERARDNTAGGGARTRTSGLRRAGLRSWLVALGVLCLLLAPIIAYDLLVSTIIYTIWPHWSHVALIFAEASVYALVVVGSLALASARGLGLLGRITERLPPAHSRQASVRQNAYLYIAGLLCLLPIPLIVSYGMTALGMCLEGFRALAALIFGLTALSCVSFSIAKSRRSLGTIRAHVQSLESLSDPDHEQEAPAEGETTARSAPARPNDEKGIARVDDTAAAAAGPRSSWRGRALVGAGILALIAIPLVNYQQALCRQGAHLGGLLGWAGRYEDALTAWEWAVRSDPDDAIAHHGRGAMLAGLGRYEEAISALDRAIQLDPDLARAHRARGATLLGLGRYEEALAAFDRAIELDPDDAWAHYNRACAYSLLGRKNEALHNLKTAIDLDGELRESARTDDGFDNLQGDPEFRSLVGLDNASSE